MLENILSQLKDSSAPVFRLELKDVTLSYFACCKLELAMRNHMDTITVVKLNGVALNKTNLTLLVNALKYFTHLVELDLSDNPLDDDVDNLLQELWLSLPTLQTISLGKTGIGKKTVQAIAEVLSKNLVLQTLDLSHNALTEETGIILCAALTFNTQLNKIDIKGNRFSNSLKNFINYFSIKTSEEKNSVFSNREECINYLSDKLKALREAKKVKAKNIVVDKGENIIHLRLLPDKNSLVIEMSNKENVIWNLQTQKKLQVLPQFLPIAYRKQVVATLSNGYFVTNSDEDRQWKVWQFDMSIQRWKDIQSNDGILNRSLELPEGQAIGTIATAAYASDLTLWDVTSVPWKIIQSKTINKATEVLLNHDEQIFISSTEPDPADPSNNIYTLDVLHKISGIWHVAQSISLNYRIEQLLVNVDGTLLSGGMGRMSIWEKDSTRQWQSIKTLDFNGWDQSAEPLLGLTRDLAIICHAYTSFLCATYDVEIWDMANNKQIKLIERYFTGEIVFTLSNIFMPINAEMFITQGIDWQNRRDISYSTFKLWRIKKDYSIKLVREFNIPKDESKGQSYTLVKLPDNRIAIGTCSGELVLCTIPELDKQYKHELIAAIAEQVELLQEAVEKLEVKLPIRKTKPESFKHSKGFTKPSNKANPQFFSASKRSHSSSNNNNVSPEENENLELQVRRVRIDVFRPSRRAERKDFIELQAEYPQAIFLLPDNYPDCNLAPQSLHTSKARGGLAKNMRPKKLAGNDANPVYDLSIIGIPTGSHDRTVTEIALQQHIKNAFARVYTQLKLGRPIFIPYKLKCANEVPAFGDGVFTLTDNMRAFLYKQFNDLEDFSKGRLALGTLDIKYQKAWQNADPVRDKWPVAQEIYSMPAAPSFKL